MAAIIPVAITSAGDGNDNDKDDDDGNDDALFSALIKSLADVNSNMAKVQKRMREKADECQESSKRRRCSELEVEVKAEQMSLESNKLRDKANELWKRSKSLEYEAMLVRLILNDEDIRVVNGNDLIPHGHGQSLGEALLYNTAVTNLEIDLAKFLLDDSGSEDSKETKLLLTFLDNRSLLRFGARVGDFAERDVAEYRKLSSMLLNRLLKCQQLERLTWALPLSVIAFHRVMTTLESLRELDLVIDDKERHWYSDVQKRAIVCAFQSNNTLQKLKLCIEDVDLLAAILIAVQENGTLRDLHLTARGGEGHDYFEALVSYLHSARALRRLEMEGFCMTESRMTMLLRGLQRPSGTSGCGTIPKVTISSLYFTACYIFDEACERLATFLQTKTTNIVGTPILESHLHTIHVSSDPDCFDWESMDRTCSGMMATSLLMVPSNTSSSAKFRNRRPIFIPTIGSQIRCVSLEGVRRRFFHILRTHSHQVGHLHTLELDRLSRGAAMAFSKCISELVSLRKLKIIPRSFGDWNLNLIVDGLKQNGGIIDVDTCDSGRSEFNSTQLSLIQAYVQRNRHLNALLASDQGLVNAGDIRGTHNSAVVDGACDPGMDTVDDESRDSDSSNGNSSNNNTSKASSDNMASNANLLVRPSLLQCTGQIPRTHTAMMIRGLSVLGQNIGY